MFSLAVHPADAVGGGIIILVGLIVAGAGISGLYIALKKLQAEGRATRERLKTEQDLRERQIQETRDAWRVDWDAKFNRGEISEHTYHVRLQCYGYADPPQPGDLTYMEYMQFQQVHPSTAGVGDGLEQYIASERKKQGVGGLIYGGSGAVLAFVGFFLTITGCGAVIGIPLIIIGIVMIIRGATTTATA